MGNIKKSPMNSKKEHHLTGYPSIDKPWLKYYREDAINGALPKNTMYGYAWENNKDNLSDVLFEYYGSNISYSTFFKRVIEIAKALKKIGIMQGDIVTVMSMHTPETIYLIYALNYMGVVANMVYMTLAENEIVRTIQHTESKLFFVLEPALERVVAVQDKINIPIIVLPIAESMPFYLKVLVSIRNQKKTGFKRFKEFFLCGQNEETPIYANDPDAVAAIVYTSGTTGEPKGVMLTNNGLNALVYQDINGIISFRRKLNFLFMLPPFIGYGYAHMHVAICAGLRLNLQIELMPQIVAKTLFKNRTECFCAGPAFLDAILNHGVSKLDKLKFFICGGGEVSNEKEKQVNEFLGKCGARALFSNGYGMTEASSVLSTNCNEISKMGSLGIPFVKTNVKVIDTETGNELKFGEVGELYFSTPSLMKGYYKNDEATKQTLCIDKNGVRWLKTGDLGYVDEDGFVFMSGRIKRIFYVRAGVGEICRLFPSHIEEILEKHSAVASCAVVVRKDKELISVPRVYLTLTEIAHYSDKNIIINELKDLVEKELPKHMQPETITIISQMPMTQSGKIDYRALDYKSKNNT